MPQVIVPARISLGNRYLHDTSSLFTCALHLIVHSHLYSSLYYFLVTHPPVCTSVPSSARPCSIHSLPGSVLFREACSMMGDTFCFASLSICVVPPSRPGTHCLLVCSIVLCFARWIFDVLFEGAQSRTCFCLWINLNFGNFVAV